MKKGFSIILLIVFSVHVRAQAPNRFYTKFGGSGIEVGYSVKEIYNRQYIVLGSTTSYGNGSLDAYLLLVDSMGKSVWEKTFGGINVDVGKSVIMNPLDSGFIFTGHSNSIGSNEYDFYVVRTDKNGILLWQRRYGGNDWDFGTDLVISSDGEIIVCGNSYSGSYGKSDGYIIKIKMNTGELIWQKFCGSSEDDEFLKIHHTSDGLYSIVGNSNGYGDINGDFWLYKINSNGDSIHSTIIGNPNKNEKCYDFVEDYNNSLVFCGSYDTSFNNIGKNISYLKKTNLNGNFINESKIPGAFTDDDKLLSISNVRIGSAYFFSRKVHHLDLDIDIQPVLTNSIYVVLYALTYGDDGEDIAFETDNTKDNGFIMTGSTNGFGGDSQDLYLLKLDIRLDSSFVGVDVTENEQRVEKFKTYYVHQNIRFNNLNVVDPHYKLTSLNGVEICSGKIENSSLTLPSNLPIGMYIIQIKELQNVRFKIITY